MGACKQRILSFMLAIVAGLSLFSSTAFARGGEDEEPINKVNTSWAEDENGEDGTTEPDTASDSTDTSTAPGSSDTSSQSLTPEGNMSLQDDISSTESAGQQFITLTTRNGNYFYLIIDRNKDGENNVHFLNQVDESDLMSLMESGTAAPVVCSCTDKCVAGAVNTACELCAVDMTECVGKEPPPEPEPEPETEVDPDPPPEPQPVKDSSSILLAIGTLVVLAGGGVVWFLKFRKKKPDTKGSTDLDDYDYGEDDTDEEESEDEDT